jgi:hypothetical protein
MAVRVVEISSWGTQNLKYICLKIKAINIPKENFENWCNGEVSKSAKIWLSKSIFLSKTIGIFLNFFFIEEYQFRSTFFVFYIFTFLPFLIISIFKSLYFLKWCPIFDSSPLLQFSKFNNFIWVCWFSAKKLSNFVSLPWKLHNRYCHDKWLSTMVT